jgi:hypothetical protein
MSESWGFFGERVGALEIKASRLDEISYEGGLQRGGLTATL